MTIQTLTNCKLFVGGYDLSGDMNALALKYGAEAKDKTNFGSGGFRERLPGLKDASFQHEGLWNADIGGADTVLQPKIASADVVTICATAAAEAEIAYTGNFDFTEYAPGERIGEVLKFSVGGNIGSSDLVRGTVMHNAARVAGGNGTIMNLGAVAAGKKLYAALHVLAISGGAPVFGCKIQSAAAVGFLTPTDRVTFTNAGAVGAQWSTLAGPVTDAYWRVVYTLSGITSVTFAVIAGIQ